LALAADRVLAAALVDVDRGAQVRLGARAIAAREVRARDHQVRPRELIGRRGPRVPAQELAVVRRELAPAPRVQVDRADREHDGRRARRIAPREEALEEPRVLERELALAEPEPEGHRVLQARGGVRAQASLAVLALAALLARAVLARVALVPAR